MAIPSDELLLAACARGDEEAFGGLVARYSGVLDAFFRRRLPDDGRIEELRQETLLAIYALLPSYREKGRFRSLVFTIAYRKLASARRAERAEIDFSEEVRAVDSDPLAFEVRAAIDSLPETLRESLVLTRLDGLTAREAGEVLGCSEEAVRARSCRARSLLAKKLRPKQRGKS